MNEVYYIYLTYINYFVLFVVAITLLISLLKMGQQPAQRAASTGNLTVSLPSENVLFLLTTRRKEKRKKKTERTLFKHIRKVPEHDLTGLKALV